MSGKGPALSIAHSINDLELYSSEWPHEGRTSEHSSFASTLSAQNDSTVTWLRQLPISPSGDEKPLSLTPSRSPSLPLFVVDRFEPIEHSGIADRVIRCDCSDRDHTDDVCWLRLVAWWTAAWWSVESIAAINVLGWLAVVTCCKLNDSRKKVLTAPGSLPSTF